MKRVRLFGVFTLLFMLSIPLLIQINGVAGLSDQNPVTTIQAGKQYLVLIAIDEYAEWKNLTRPVKDSQRLKAVLTEYYHFDEIVELYNKNATRRAIYNLLKSFQKGGTRQLAETDSLFIYHSGHGYLDESTDKGYWIPYDGAGAYNKMSKANWLDNSELRGLVRRIQSNHILIASDSCFAGTLVANFKGDNVIIDSLKVLKTIYPIKACKILTAGAKEQVPDQSVFARLFTDELKKNRSNFFVKISSIYNRIEEEIIKKTGNTQKGNRPLYGDFAGAHSRAGSRFILFTKKGWQKLVQPSSHRGISYCIPGSAPDNMFKGITFMGEGKLDMAEKKLTTATLQDPDLVDAQNALGILYFKREEFDKAKKRFNLLIKLKPAYFASYNYLGMIYTQEGNYEEAKKNLLKAAHSEKNLTPEYCYINLAELEMTNGNRHSALRYAEQGLDKNWHFAPLYNLKGIIYEQTKEYEKSIFNYEKALKALDKGDISTGTLSINLGRIYAKTGQKTKALNILEKALSMIDSPREQELEEQIQALINRINRQE